MEMVGLKDNAGFRAEGAGRGISAHCACCKCQRDFVRHFPRHCVHLLFSIFTGGLWLFGWLVLCVECALRPWRCGTCGWHKPEFRRPLEDTLQIGERALHRTKARVESGAGKVIGGPWSGRPAASNLEVIR
jgi:hypothetical protein